MATGLAGLKFLMRISVRSSFFWPDELVLLYKSCVYG